MHQSYIRPRRVQIVAIACLIPTAIKDVITAVPGAIADFAHEVKEEMNDRKKLADMLYTQD